MSVRLGVSGVFLLLLGVGCSGSGPTLTVDPTTLTVTAGGAPASLTATLTGSSTAITWSVSGPGSVNPSTGTTTSYTPPSTATAAATATLTATAGNLTATAIVTVNPPAPTLAIHPKTLNVVAGATASNFTATLTGSTDTISWNLVGPGSVSTSAGTTTSYTPPPSASSAASATLTASAAGLTASASIGLPLPITVTGKVLLEDGRPVADTPVIIGSQSTTTDVGGSFTVSNVAAPYDLIAVLSIPNPIAIPPVVQTAVMYQALTRTDPTITSFWDGSALSPGNGGQLTGAISGGDPPADAADVTYVSFGSPETATSGFAAYPDPYNLTAAWAGPKSTTGTLHALRYTPDAGGVSQYKGSATISNVTVTNGATTTQDITLTPVSSEHLSGEITSADTTFFESAGAFLNFDDGARLVIASDNFPYMPPSTQVSFDYLTPSGLGTISLVATGAPIGSHYSGFSDTYLFGLAPNATGVSVALQRPPQLLAPAAGAAAITTVSDFTWSAFTGGITYVQFIPQGTFIPIVSIVTASTTTNIPDLSAYGLALVPGGATYTWQVHGWAPYADVDAFAGGHSLFPSGAAAFYEGFSSEWPFTTQ